MSTSKEKVQALNAVKKLSDFLKMINKTEVRNHSTELGIQVDYSCRVIEGQLKKMNLTGAEETLKKLYVDISFIREQPPEAGVKQIVAGAINKLRPVGKEAKDSAYTPKDPKALTLDQHQAIEGLQQLFNSKDVKEAKVRQNLLKVLDLNKKSEAEIMLVNLLKVDRGSSNGEKKEAILKVIELIKPGFIKSDSNPYNPKKQTEFLPMKKLTEQQQLEAQIKTVTAEIKAKEKQKVNPKTSNSGT